MAFKNASDIAQAAARRVGILRQGDFDVTVTDAEYRENLHLRLAAYRSEMLASSDATHRAELTMKIHKIQNYLDTWDRIFVNIDLKQAETRFVAYDACEDTLMRMLICGEDIHKYVAAEIYAKPMAEITYDERQLGKKSGHGANYNMGVATFQDSALKEMDLVLDRKMATKVLESYHKLFPGIRRWHSQIRNQVYNERCLRNPLGRIRYFYGRTDDNTYREAYAYRPQSTVPDIANHLMLGLCDQRREAKLDFWLHLQCHDSVLLSCKRGQEQRIAAFAHNLDLWHPRIILPAGQLKIPVDVASGTCLGQLSPINL